MADISLMTFFSLLVQVVLDDFNEMFVFST